jgi:ketosteroid isomerase-like protein
MRMSDEAVEVVRRAYERLARGDVDGAAELLDPDAEWLPYLGMVEGEVFRGRAAIVKLWSDITAHLSGFTVEPEELIDRGDKVVAVVRATGSGSGSGAAVEQRWAQLVSVSGGSIHRVEAFPDREAALRAAGPDDRAAPTGASD